MGASSSSFEENLQEKTSNINATKNQIDRAFNQINQEANRIISMIVTKGFNDREKVCSQLGYQKVDELSSFFSLSTLEGVRYRLGIIPQDNLELEKKKQKVCLDIVNFYLKKINLIENIKRELPKCRNIENSIYNGLSERLKSENVRDQEWLVIYNKMNKFNEEIKARYGLIERELERINSATTMREIDSIAQTTNSILAKTNSICKTYENDLIPYAQPSRSVQTQPSYQPQTQPPRPVQTQPQVHTVIKEVPVTQRTVIKPVVTKHEVINQPVEPLTVPPQPIVSSSSPIKYTKSTSFTTATSPISSSSELPIIPLHTLQEFQPQKTKKTIKVTGEQIQKRNGTLVVKNPNLIEVTRTVPRSQIGSLQRSLKPGTKITKIEPQFTKPIQRIPSGTPVRAISDRPAQGPNELHLKKNQATSYIRPGPRGWAYVKHNDGKEGYVPASHLSL